MIELDEKKFTQNNYLSDFLCLVGFCVTQWVAYHLYNLKCFELNQYAACNHKLQPFAIFSSFFIIFHISLADIVSAVWYRRIEGIWRIDKIENIRIYNDNPGSFRKSLG